MPATRAALCTNDEIEYGFGPTFSSVTTWVAPAGNFNFISPVFTTTAGPIDGNSIGRAADLGGTITNLTWQSGTTLWLRWVESNDSGTDAAMAIDNFSFSGGLGAVPEAGAICFCTLACCSFGLTAGSRYAIRWLCRHTTHG